MNYSYESSIIKQMVSGDNVIYIDDSPEDIKKDVYTITLPHEGSGLSPRDLMDVYKKRKELISNGKNVINVFDFDCTLSKHHLFKTLYYPNSPWVEKWKNTENAGDQSISNIRFCWWIMGGLERVEIIRAWFVEDRETNNVVLTNGIADDVVKVLERVGLLEFFRFIADTRGNVILILNDSKPKKIRISDERYSKEFFINKFILNNEKIDI